MMKKTSCLLERKEVVSAMEPLLERFSAQPLASCQLVRAGLDQRRHNKLPLVVVDRIRVVAEHWRTRPNPSIAPFDRGYLDCGIACS